MSRQGRSSLLFNICFEMNNEIEEKRKKKVFLLCYVCGQPHPALKTGCSLPLGEKQQAASKLSQGVQGKLTYICFFQKLYNQFILKHQATQSVLVGVRIK